MLVTALSAKALTSFVFILLPWCFTTMCERHRHSQEQSHCDWLPNRARKFCIIACLTSMIIKEWSGKLVLFLDYFLEIDTGSAIFIHSISRCCLADTDSSPHDCSRSIFAPQWPLVDRPLAHPSATGLGGLGKL